MKNSAVVKKIADGIYASILDGVGTLKDVKASKVEALKDMSVEEGLDAVTALAKDVEAVITAASEDGVFLPSFLSSLNATGGSFNSVTLSVRSKLKASYKYRKDITVEINDDFIENLTQAYMTGLWDIFYIEQAIDNVAALNERISVILQENEIPFGIEFRVDHSTEAQVLEITDENVVFNVDIVRALNIPDLGIFAEGDEYATLVNEEAVKNFVDSVKSAQTTVQLIKAKVGVIVDVTGLSTKKRASKLIHKSYHRQAKYLGRVKSGIGYFEDTVKVNGEDVDVFSLVEKTADGTLKVVLTPFDTKTMFSVDFDVIKAVEAQLAE